MTDSTTAITELKRIEELWEKLKSAESDMPGYAALMKQIGAASGEYQKLVEAVRVPHGVTSYGSR
jgi:hypothetical protein